ncbi:MAG TPA: hypothetical protein VLJ88_12935, partial [Propionibacteriaceae bacterium]|nr:hypothetical protein [Propionibacteriaceae bacterium]
GASGTRSPGSLLVDGFSPAPTEGLECRGPAVPTSRDTTGNGATTADPVGGGATVGESGDAEPGDDELAADQAGAALGASVSEASGTTSDVVGAPTSAVSR